MPSSSMGEAKQLELLRFESLKTETCVTIIVKMSCPELQPLFSPPPYLRGYCVSCHTLTVRLVRNVASAMFMPRKHTTFCQDSDMRGYIARFRMCERINLTLYTMSPRLDFCRHRLHVSRVPVRLSSPLAGQACFLQCYG